MDIYTPQTGMESYPILIIYHGGGWLINTNAIMDSMSVYMVEYSELVVCNVNIRLLGDQSNTITINQIIEDAMGALVWIKEHISTYKGDSKKIILTGDSSGGHLAAMVLLAGNDLESDGFEGTSLGYNPTYLPFRVTAEDLASNNYLDVQGAILSYAAFDMYSSCLNGGFETSSNIFWYLAAKSPRGLFGNEINVNDNPEYYLAVSPIYIIPDASDRILPPQFCLVGSADNTVSPQSVQTYVDSCEQAGQVVEYWEYAGKPHAFLDSTPNAYLGTEFTRDAPPALDKMIEFINGIFFTTKIESVDNHAKFNFKLHQNYPNPFNPSTKISYTVGTYHNGPLQNVNLSIYNISGQKVATLVNKYQPEGTYDIWWNASGVSTGVYIYQLQAGNYIETKKMILLQ